jgi:hypothetical protein
MAHPVPVPADSPARESLALGVGAACLAWVLGPLQAVAQSPETVTLESCRGECGLSLVLEAEYGDDTGPGMIDLTGFVMAYRDASKRTYIIGKPIDNVLVFDSSGLFLRRIGRTGSGPGEFEDGASLVVTGDGEFSVLDRDRSVVLNFEYTGRLRGETRPVGGWYPYGVDTYHWEGPWVVHVATLNTPDRAGYPLHLVNVETGEIGRSFGSTTGELELGGAPVPQVAIASDRRVWMVRRPGHRYEIGLWDGNERQLLLRRDAPWFPDRPDDAPRPHGLEDMPTPAISELVAGDSLLWVRGSVADERWREASYRDRDGRFDHVLEVIDPRSNRVVGSQRFDRAFSHFIEPGLIGRVDITGNGSVRFRAFRVVLEASDRRASVR